MPYITVDAVRYSDLPPWPVAADGAGASLQRRVAGAYGNDPANWFASGITPGLDNSPVTGPDRDGDGMPDAWEIDNGTNPDVADAGADPDSDGLTNLREYFAGTSPTNALSVLRIESISLEAGSATARLSFNAVSNRTYTVQWRQSLDSGTWQKLADVAESSTNRVHSVTDSAAGSSARYYRLVTPLQP